MRLRAGKSRPHRSGPTWPAIFVGGLALWVATVLVTFATQNSNLIPTIILLGSFLVPVTFVTIRVQPRRSDHHSPADLRCLRRRRDSWGARRFASGSRASEDTIRVHLPLGGADRGGSQARRTLAARLAPAPLQRT